MGAPQLIVALFPLAITLVRVSESAGVKPVGPIALALASRFVYKRRAHCFSKSRHTSLGEKLMTVFRRSRLCAAVLSALLPASLPALAQDASTTTTTTSTDQTVKTLDRVTVTGSRIKVGPNSRPF